MMGVASISQKDKAQTVDLHKNKESIYDSSLYSSLEIQQDEPEELDLQKGEAGTTSTLELNIQHLEDIRNKNQIEIWRQRDLLIGQEAEIGVLKAEKLKCEYEISELKKTLALTGRILRIFPIGLLVRLAKKIKRIVKG